MPADDPERPAGTGARYGYPEYPRLGPAVRGPLLVIVLLALDAGLIRGALALTFAAAFGLHGGEVFLAAHGLTAGLITLSAYVLRRRGRPFIAALQYAVGAGVAVWVLYVLWAG
ncbi:hypothetical protein I3F58_23185 [Streptomyces sp. MUM 203J]|uniref:hypothetical protein n=1 Tax=Streptomyces sp. MUM 203J TaxID=2791990 RepID=UPI001F03CCD0|nr:hypothetical protein [Streptomyces sp. MUM 203J]MCH0542403.1 hypothetical protein [Streptomyces sp. MUM 203J]